MDDVYCFGGNPLDRVSERRDVLCGLGGAAVLFGLLAIVMIATRRVDWYALTAKPAENRS